MRGTRLQRDETGRLNIIIVLRPFGGVFVDVLPPGEIVMLIADNVVII
jgi:hypothetical protein